MKNQNLSNSPRGIYEPDYALILDCHDLKGPEYRHGMKLLFSMSAPVRTGDLCAVTFTSGHSHMIFLETDIPDYVLKNLPYIESSKSDVHQIFLGRPLGSDDCLSIRAAGVQSVHRCVGHYEAGVGKAGV